MILQSRVYNPNFTPTNPDESRLKNQAEETKSRVDHFVSTFLKLDNSEFDLNPAKDVVDLREGVRFGETIYQGTYDRGEMSANMDFDLGGGVVENLESVRVRRNNFGFDRLHSVEADPFSGWSAYDDIRGGLVAFSSGTFESIPV